MRYHTAILAAALASSAIVGATVTASPAGADAGTDPRWRATVTHDSVVTTMEAGAFTLAADHRSVSVRDAHGRELASLPLSLDIDGHRYPITQQISPDGRRLTLTPDPAVAFAARPIASPVENQLALTELAGKMTTATMAGTVGGTVIGLLIGAVVGLGSCLVVGPACVATAPAALAAFAGAGGLAGMLLVGGGTLVGGLWKYLTTVQAAPGTSEYAGRGGLGDPDGTGVPDATPRLPRIVLPSGSASGSAGR
ncbi:hypothetical protein [Nocardia cyriacigeorgica]|uniref:hypothetical protein n=1 Tax=Nocardia cyriacigeorgica TaxID=135487 RepID=UPI0024567A3E|nr:hypothetical protein [Nocardia cyriacigeorgica]